ncbi:MAG: hypothetical protein AAF467_14105 [Actinomycetota bacterium]
MTVVLGNQASTGSTVERTPEQAKADRYRASRELQGFNAWAFSARQMTARNGGAETKAERVASCGVRIKPRVGLKRNPESDGRIATTGVKTCGSVWSCLACAAKIRARRAEEIDAITKAHLADGGGVTFLTFTLPHVATDSLDELVDALTKSWRGMTSGEKWKDKIKPRFDVISQITSFEATIGANGWHPHLHVLFFHWRPLDLDRGGEFDQFVTEMGERWGTRIARRLGRETHAYYGVKGDPVRDNAGIGAYVSKIHFEMARSDLKHGDVTWDQRSPWQLGLDAARTGEAQDIARWVEWHLATKGRNAIQIPIALRDLYAEQLAVLGQADKTDEDIAAEDQGGEIEAWISAPAYDALRQANRHTGALSEFVITYQHHGLQPAVRQAKAHGVRLAVVVGRTQTPTVILTGGNT